MRWGRPGERVWVVGAEEGEVGEGGITRYDPTNLAISECLRNTARCLMPFTRRRLSDKGWSTFEVYNGG